MAALGIRRNRRLTVISIAGIFHKTLGLNSFDSISLLILFADLSLPSSFPWKIRIDIFVQ